MNYDKEYFIRKFEAIPDEKWCVVQKTNGKGQHCAIGFCGDGLDDSPECLALGVLFGNDTLKVAFINDGNDRDYKQPTPKARILAALHDLP